MAKRKSQSEKIGIIRELYEAGSSIEAIAEVLGYKPVTVNQLLSLTGIKRSRRVETYKNDIFKMRNEGRSIKYIAQETGFTKETISKFLCENGMGRYMTAKNRMLGEPDLVDENTVFVEEKKEPVERIFVFGKWYVTVPFSEIFQN